MTSSTAPELVVAHHLGAEFEAQIGPSLPPGVRLVALTPETAYEVPPEARVLVVGPLTAGQFGAPAEAPVGWPRNLEWVQVLPAGIDGYPRWLFEAPLVTNGRGLNSETIAEFVLANMLAVAKRFPDVWVDSRDAWKRMRLASLRDQTLGLLGLGSIGSAVARMARPFGMKIIANRRSDQPAEGVTLVDFETLLTEADHLVVTAPLTAETRHQLNADAFARVKKGVHIVNISRGGVIDHDALVAALESGQVGFASLDVTEPEPLPAGHPLYTHPHVHISPHLCWSGGQTQSGFPRLFLENLARFRAGEQPENVVTSAGY